jgi:hypothetical protein
LIGSEILLRGELLYGVQIDNFFSPGGESAGIASGAVEFYGYTVGGSSFSYDLVSAAMTSPELA